MSGASSVEPAPADEAAQVEATPQTPRRGALRARAAASIALIAIGAMLAPAAVTLSWARVQLTDTQAFVQTLAPLSSDPAVQDAIVLGATRAIERTVPIDSLVDDVFSSLTAIGVPERGTRAMRLLLGSQVADAARSSIERGVRRAIEAPAFDRTWRGALQLTHANMVRVLEGGPRGGEDDALDVDLGALVPAVRDELQGRGFGLASRIPDVEVRVVLVPAEQMRQARVAYAVALAVGWWLPFVSLALVVGGVLLARRRRVVTGRALFTLAGVFVAFALALVIGRHTLARVAADQGMPADAADAVYGQLTGSLLGSAIAIAVVALIAGAVVLIFGDSPRAVALRRWRLRH